MGEKVVEMTKENDEGVLPIERDALLKDLQDISPEITNEYTKAIERNVEEILLFKNIISSASYDRISRNFIESLDELRFRRLQSLVLNLKANEPEKKVKEIVEATFGYAIYPIPENIPRAEALLKKLKDRGDYETEWKELAALARDIQMLSHILVVLKMGDELEVPMLERLSRLSENDLDRLIEAAEVK